MTRLTTCNPFLQIIATDTNAISRGWTNHVSFWKPEGVQEYLAISGHFFVGILKDGRTVLDINGCTDVYY